MDNKDYNQQIVDYLKQLVSDATKFQNEMALHIDKWTIAVAAGGVAFVFTIMSDYEGSVGGAWLLSLVAAVLSLSMLLSLLSRGCSYLTALDVKRKASRAVTIEDVDQKYSVASSISYSKFDKLNYVFGFASFGLLVIALLLMAAASVSFSLEYDGPSKEVQIVPTEE